MIDNLEDFSSSGKYYNKIDEIGAKANSLVFLNSIGMNIPNCCIIIENNLDDIAKIDFNRDIILRSSSKYVMDGILPSEIFKKGELNAIKCMDKYVEFADTYFNGKNASDFNRLNNIKDNNKFSLIIQEYIPGRQVSLFTHCVSTSNGSKSNILDSHAENSGWNIPINNINKYIFSIKKCPQEIEYVFNGKNNLYVVQTKDINIPYEDNLKKNLTTGVSFKGKGKVIGRISFGKNYLDEDYILVTNDTSPNDYEVLFNSKGVIGLKGTLSSHCSVSCLKLNKPCIVGLYNCKILSNLIVDFNNEYLKEGDLIEIDSDTGLICRKLEN